MQRDRHANFVQHSHPILMIALNCYVSYLFLSDQVTAGFVRQSAPEETMPAMRKIRQPICQPNAQVNAFREDNLSGKMDQSLPFRTPFGGFDTGNIQPIGRRRAATAIPGWRYVPQRIEGVAREVFTTRLCLERAPDGKATTGVQRSSSKTAMV